MEMQRSVSEKKTLEPTGTGDMESSILLEQLTVKNHKHGGDWRNEIER